jgi:hypothetical protein
MTRTEITTDYFSILNDLVQKLGLHMRLKSTLLTDTHDKPPRWQIEITLESSFTCFGEGGCIKSAKKVAAHEIIKSIEHLLNAELTMSKIQLQKIPSLIRVS